MSQLPLQNDLAVTPELARFPNHILNSINDEDAALLEPHLRNRSLPVSKLERAGRACEYVYFPDGGLVSLCDDGDRNVEISQIGREGFVGLSVVLGAPKAALSAHVVVAGDAHFIDAAEPRSCMAQSTTLRLHLLQFAHALHRQFGRVVSTAVSNTVEQRLARWLLLASERTELNGLPVTHSVLADLLGVRRAGISVALNKLEDDGVLQLGRRSIQVLNHRERRRIAGSAISAADKI